MSRALIIELSRFGFSHDPGPPRTMRIGFLHVAISPVALVDGIHRQSRAIAACQRLLWMILQRARHAAASSGAAGTPPQLPLDDAFMGELDEAATALRETVGDRSPPSPAAAADIDPVRRDGASS